MKSEKQKMIDGEWFDVLDAELVQDRNNTMRAMHRFNACGDDSEKAYAEAQKALCPNVKGFIRTPVYCDYGYNIYAEEGSFINFDCVLLDLAPIRIGRDVLIAPKVQLLTATHPFDAAERASGMEQGRAITIGDNCWLGSGVIVCPGVTIGDRTIIGAGSVVTKDIPADSVAVGNPARVIRKL